MEEYKLIKGNHGNRFMKNNRFVKYDDVPEEVRNKLETGLAAADSDDKTCIFCGEPSTETRFVNMQTIALCMEHFYSKGVGQIVQRLKEVYNA